MEKKKKIALGVTEKKTKKTRSRRDRKKKKN